MIQRDYILRLIDQLGALLRALLGSKDHIKKPEIPISNAAQLDVALEKSCREAMGLSFWTINEMPPAQLMEMLHSGGATWVSRCFFVGRLFEFNAEIATRLNQNERAKESMERALYFYNFLLSNPEVPDEYHVEERFKNVAKLVAASGPRLPRDTP